MGSLVRGAARHLRERAGAACRLEAELLTAHFLGIERPALYVRWEEPVAPEVAQATALAVDRRLAGEPLAYLLGKRDFMGLDFAVSPAVLVPRPETELLVETALGLLATAGPSPRAADVGTGSGAIAVSLAVLHPRLRVLALDLSPGALAVALTNAARHGVARRVAFRRTDLLAGVEGPFDLVAANLPYIPTGEIDLLPVEVRREPRLALDGGHDGLELYRRLVPQAERVLPPGGWLLAEIAPSQAAPFLELLAPPLWSARVERDWAGHPRLVAARRAG